MIVYHSYFDPSFEQWLTATIVAYVDSESGVSDSLETAVYEIAEHHNTGVMRHGHYHVPGFGYFWSPGHYPRFESQARELENGVLHGVGALVGYFRTLSPFGRVSAR